MPDILQGSIEGYFQSLKTGSSAGFAACDENCLGIRRPKQPPTVVSLHAHAVDVINDRTFRAQTFGDLFNHGELLCIAAGESCLRRIDDGRPLPTDLGKCSAFLAQDPNKPDRSIKGVIVAIVWFAKEDVAAHLSSQRSARLGHLRFYEGVAGAPHQRQAAGTGNLIEKRLTGF